MGARGFAGADNNGVCDTSVNTGQPHSFLCGEKSEVFCREGGREKERTFELSLSEAGGKSFFWQWKEVVQKVPGWQEVGVFQSREKLLWQVWQEAGPGLCRVIDHGQESTISFLKK